MFQLKLTDDVKINTQLELGLGSIMLQCNLLHVLQNVSIIITG